MINEKKFPVRFKCKIAIGAPDDEYILMVGSTGVIFVEGPKGHSAILSEIDSRELAKLVLSR